MSCPFQWLGVGSTEELIGLLPRALTDGRDTMLYNAAKWQDGGQLARAIRDTRAIVADNDGSVIAGSQWDDLRLRMSDTHRQADAEEAAAYFRGERTDDGDVEFLLRGVGRLVDSGLRLSQVREDAARQTPRSGTRELLASYHGRSAVVTYGVDAYAEEWAVFHRLWLTEVFAANLRWDRTSDDPVLVGCDRATVITEANKGLAREDFSRRHGLVARKVLVLEDTPRTLARMKHPDNVGVLVAPRHDPQPNRPEGRMRQLADPSFFSSIDVVIASDSLESLAFLRK
ncbi:hypothetical protein A2304_04830 [Candidatus Uhrbacteria bacterium RIFOXYB2_FULL_57_15]|uniref:Uncharacterized protein n=1 Tax=Candidatus Uhrbacteria bacterium RIFOXYB2_FULL_57_15 TaxID=1802422 RepID=A0A1F7W7N1_9BACT|nr:MAG: hypothetical protein A2304_04830 [Candidatus Uhrbacteria bacterium RIFOXYB2_FULL_57_15]OGL99798.1 MAG: hypothetical protein A2501_04720 [Candidatus Uhrbacteria bacterium RIFOXYC12_FULL_57_11]